MAGSSTPTRICWRCGCTDNDCSGCVERTGAPCRWAHPGNNPHPDRDDLCSACINVVIPDLPTPAMLEVLGLSNNRIRPLAASYRAAGYDVPDMPGGDRAFVLSRFLPLAILHGARWNQLATADVHRIELGTRRAHRAERVLGARETERLLGPMGIA